MQVSGNEIAIKNGHEWTTFERVYDEQSRENDIFESDLQRVVPLIIDGYSVSLFSFGSYSSDKREILTGLIQLLFKDLWTHLSNKSKSFQIAIHALEIVEDTIFDLIDPSNVNLCIEHTIDGPSVLNITSSSLKSPNDFGMLLNEMMDNRTQQLTEFGPKASKASFFLTLRIKHNDIHSLLQFVELPAADKLIENQNEVTHIFPYVFVFYLCDCAISS